jgi:hypothetical protein
MAYFKIAEPGHAVKYIKEIDRANGTLEFSEDRNGCFQQDSGFFADSEFAYLMFHFKEAYPELQYMTIDTNWYASNDEELVGEVVQEEDAPDAPNDDPMPWDDGNAVVEAPRQIRAPRQINDAVNAIADYQAMGDMYAPVFNQAAYNVATNTMDATEEVNGMP